MSDSSQSSSFAIPTLALMVVLGWGTWTAISELRSARPAESVSSALASGDQRLGTRLWRDPFADIDSWKAQKLDETQSLYCCEPSPPSDRSVLILPIITDGSGYAEARERRLRDRYALVAGLIRAEYTPANSDAIGVMKARISVGWDDPNAEGTSTDFGPPCLNRHILVPFERFVSAQGRGAQCRDPRYPEVLILWLRSQVVEAPDIDARVRTIVQGLTWLDHVTPRVKVLGPWSSDGLVHLAADSSPHPTLPIEYLDSSATISDDDLVAATGEQLDTADRPWRRTTAPDNFLVHALVDELEHRHITETDHGAVVLISEADTFYGRALPAAFERLWAEKGHATRSRTYRATYFRGTDGLGGGKPGGDSEASSAGPQPAPGPSLLAREQDEPTGPAQRDYLRRTVERLKDEVSSNGDAVRAVGVFATDVYDKLLILQALKGKFPGAVFFTTDMDARYLMPSQYRWTRNLVVASGYDLRLGPALQGSLPPFRDCYQSSLFLSVLAAVNHCEPPDESTLPVAVFEIGRTRALNLTGPMPKGECQVEDPGSVPSALTDLFPATPGPMSPRRAGFSLAAVFAVIAFLAFGRVNARLVTGQELRRIKSRSRLVRAVLSNEWNRLVTWIMVIAGLLAFCVWIVAYGQSREPVLRGGEPFSLFEGVSVWPTECLRLFALVLCGFSVVMLLGRWDDEALLTADEFKFKAPTKAPKRRFRLTNWAYIENPPDADTLWSQLVAVCSTSDRIRRTLIATTIYFAFGFTVFKSFESSVRPARGDFADNLDRILIRVLAFASSFLVLVVWDATRVALRFIRSISAEQPTVYNDHTRSLVPDLDAGPASAVLNVAIIGRITATLGPAYRYPALVLFLMIVSRSSVFDNWTLGAPLIIIMAVGFGITLASAWVLRSAAERVRHHELRKLEAFAAELRAKLIHAPDSESDLIEHKLDSIELAVTRVESARDGAFSRLRDDPVLHSVMIPVGGSVAVLAMDLVTTYALS